MSYNKNMSYNKKVMEAYAKMLLNGSAFNKENKPSLEERIRIVNRIFEGEFTNGIVLSEEFITKEEFSI